MEILCHFSIYRCNHGYKQKSLRDRGLHLDTAIDFMTHIMEQIDAGKFTPNGEAGSFYRWTNKCFRRFANTALTELTKENRRFVQMENPRTDSDEEGKPTAADKEAYTLWSKSSANQHIDGALSVLSPEDRAYAGLLKLGFAQKKAAEVMEESVPTSRIREKKIRDVIQKTIPIIQAFADEDNLLGWPKAEENSFSISACATETQARFLSPDEAAIYLGGLNSRTLTRWAREGYIPAIPIGEGKRRLWRFLESDLEGWMLARRQGGQNAA
jgi:excisionase family DNA binding protein